MLGKRLWCLALVAGLALVLFSRSASASSGTVQALVNEARAAQGLGPLSANATLAAIAEAQSARMAEAGRIFHNAGLPSEVTAAGVRWRVVGENVGVGPSVGEIQDAFMRSPTHYRNIVDGRYDSIGVGVVLGRDGRVYVTQVFGAVASASTAAQIISARPGCSDEPWVGAAATGASLALTSEENAGC